MAQKESAEKAIRDVRRKTRRRFSAEEKIRIVIEGLRGEESIALQVEQRVPGGGKEAPSGRHAARGELERSL
jgi:hypothetical protein